jgi:hypothetical protein
VEPRGVGGGGGAGPRKLRDVPPVLLERPRTVCVRAPAGQLDISWALDSPTVSAIIHAPFLGMTSGDAIAAVLTGAANPSGRLTATWYTQGEPRRRACTPKAAPLAVTATPTVL